MSIRIHVVRGDGHVTRLEGESGLATCMGPLSDRIEESDPPTIALRCYSEAELAWNLAALMGAVKHVSPRAFERAHELMRFCDFKRPQISNQLPKEG